MAVGISPVRVVYPGTIITKAVLWKRKRGPTKRTLNEHSFATRCYVRRARRAAAVRYDEARQRLLAYATEDHPLTVLIGVMVITCPWKDHLIENNLHSPNYKTH